MGVVGREREGDRRVGVVGVGGKEERGRGWAGGKRDRRVGVVVEGGGEERGRRIGQWVWWRGGGLGAGREEERESLCLCLLHCVYVVYSRDPSLNFASAWSGLEPSTSAAGGRTPAESRGRRLKTLHINIAHTSGPQYNALCPHGLRIVCYPAANHHHHHTINPPPPPAPPPRPCSFDVLTILSTPLC